ncbi:hypothetical protein GCM10027566_04950 [Arachidicoccus ginsenosidivorans]
MQKTLHVFELKSLMTIVLCGLIGVLSHLKAQKVAFPGAEGFGKYAIGARSGGSVYHVTNLNDAGAGSLRDAVSQPNRIVVFDVAGVIRINSRIVVSNNIYLAGQTAPGEGITVYGNGWSFSGASNTICRYMKIRMGIVGSDGKDANGIANGHDMIFDHCSISWGRDENFSINSTTAYNITIQNCIISQGLMSHSAGGLIQADSITLYRNLYADNTTRNNKVKGRSQYVNNIVYNWNNGAYIMGGESEGDSYVNVTNNCFIKGPENGVPPFNLGNSSFHIYAADNIFDKNTNAIFDPYLIPESEYVGPPDFQVSPFNYPTLPVWSANRLFDSLLPAVGASLPYRDYADYYVIGEVKSLGLKGELIANEGSLPFGAPTSWHLWAGNPIKDTDGDGMPDDWEIANGTNDQSDDAMNLAANGYTNIENYINSLTKENVQPYLRNPLGLTKDSATQTTVYLSWLDYTSGEDGFYIEKRVGGIWQAFDTTASNVNHLSVTGMAPEQTDTFRVVAFKDTARSGYSNELIAKSKAVVVPVLDTLTFKADLTWLGNIDSIWDFNKKNWVDQNGLAATFKDSSKLLFPDKETAQVIVINDPVTPGDILIKGNQDYTFKGQAAITGQSSLNKTGTGTLFMQNINAYKGPTVLYKGAIEFAKLANGDSVSSIGAAANYPFNWRWKGGSWVYTGKSATTDRSAIIDENTVFSVKDSSAVVTFTGTLSGEGGLIKSGPGTLLLQKENTYAGPTIINGGVLEVRPVSSASQQEDIIDENRGIGTSNIMRLHNGIYRTSGGSNTIYENYPLDLYIDDSTVNGFEPNRNANLTMTLHGNGILNYKIPYLRELIQGDWSDFSGTLIASSADNGLLIIDNNVGFPNNRVVVTGSAKIVNWNNNQTISIGGLSGDEGTMLSCGGVKTQSFGFGYTTYSVGSAGTDETFKGEINNQPYGSTSNTTGETSIIKEGAGYWRLTGNNTYSGTTTISQGQLIVNGENSGKGNVWVEGGTLSGIGSIAGNVTVQAGGSLSAGDSLMGTLRLKANLTLDSGAITAVRVNKGLDSSDKIHVADTLIYGGLLSIDTTLGALTAGSKFKIFEPDGFVAGDFRAYSPATPGKNLFWKFNPTAGILMVGAPGYVFAPSDIKLNTTTDIPTSTSSIALNWVDNSDSESYFVIERATENSQFHEVARLGQDMTNYTDSLLTPNTTYFYRLKAVVSNAQMSAYSDTVSIRTPLDYYPAAVVTSPSPTNEQQLSGFLGSKLILHWQGGAHTDSFAVYLGKDSLHLRKMGDVLFSDTASIAVTDIKSNSTYYWRVDALGGAHTTKGPLWHFTTGNPAHMIVHYSLDELSGDSAFDQSGHDLTATVNFTPVWAQNQGKINGALAFTNATEQNAALILPANEAVELDSTSFSISLWVKIPANTYSFADGKDCYLIQKGTMEANTGKWYGLQLKDNNLTFAIDDGVHKSSLSVKMEGAHNIYNNSWNHIVAVRDMASKQIYVYINGVLSGSASGSATTGIGSLDKDLTIGNSVEQKPYRDQIDDIRFYDNALTADAIADIYHLTDPASNPLRVQSFTGKEIGGKIYLKWQTEHELDTHFFQLYRSADSIHYRLLTKVWAKDYGDSLTSYSYVDGHPIHGKNYYRLMQMDEIGQRSLLAETLVLFGHKEVFDVFPNPFYGNHLHFYLKNFTEKNKFHASFYGLNGMHIVSADFKVNPQHTYTLQFPHKLRQGIYLLNVSDGVKRIEKKVIVK